MQKLFSTLNGAAGRARLWLSRLRPGRKKGAQPAGPGSEEVRLEEQRTARPLSARLRLALARLLPSPPRFHLPRLDRRFFFSLPGILVSRAADIAVTLASMIVVVFKRLRHNLGLSISSVLGIVAVLGIVVCVPVFSYAVSSQVLRAQLEEKAASTRRSLFSLHMYFQDKSNLSPLSVAQFETINRFIQEDGPRMIGIKMQRVISQVETIPIYWRPLKADGSKVEMQEPWMSMSFFSLETLPENALLVDGSWPKPSIKDGEMLQVAVLESVADASFLNVGDRFYSGPFQIEITGIWKPKDSNGSFWFNYPDTAYLDKMWIPFESYQNRLKVIARPVFYASWYVAFDEGSLHFDQAERYARGMVQFDSELRRLLPGAVTDYTPLEAVNGYQNRANTLSTLFYAVGGPMVVLALLFIALTANIAVQQYEQETATMRGRGTSWPQVVTLNLTESVALVIISLPFSLLVGWLEAVVMGQTLSFLKFTARSGLEYSLQGINTTWLVIGALFVILARFLPVLGLSRTTIVRMKQEQSRATRRPLWDRFYLDFFLLIPGLYAYVTMSGLAKPVKFLSFMQPTGENQYRDPLLFVAPALFAMALCMIIIRILPLVMRVLAFLFDRLPGVWAYLSLQQIARRPQDHSSALLLIMISLSLSIYSASTAKTLDQWQHDSLYYKAGADLAVHEYLVQGRDRASLDSLPSNNETTVSEFDLNIGGYVNLEEHLKLPSIEAITRVAKYDGSFSYGVGEQRSVIMGIDRLDFPKVAFTRDDFASQSLGALMNALGAEPMGVLVPSSVVQKTGFRIGDHLNVAVNILGQQFERDMIVVGTYDYFPTVFPENAPTLIVNMDSIFDNSDAAVGYDLWLKIRKNTDTKLLLYQLRQLVDPQRGLIKVNGNAYDDLRAAMELPERMGLFGVLNVGFIATGLMPCIGFILYSYASLRRRFIQLGILQAIGLSTGQLIGYLALEQFLLMGLAIVLGAAIGLLTSNLFVPFLQVSTTGGGAIPPFEVLIGWAEAGWLSLAFAMVLLLTVLGTIWYLAQIKVFQAVKMGETL